MTSIDRRLCNMKKTHLILLFAVSAVAFVLLNVTTARAQTASSGGVAGQISDPQGAIVPGANITLTETATKSAVTTTSNDAGRFNFPVVNPAIYDLVGRRHDFKAARFTNQKVSLGAVLTMNVALDVGAPTEAVVVTSAPIGTELHTANATVGTTINLKEMELLPNLGRDATTLMAV